MTRLSTSSGREIGISEGTLASLAGTWSLVPEASPADDETMQPSNGIQRTDALARWLAGSALVAAAFLALMFLMEATGATHLVGPGAEPTTPTTLPVVPCEDGATGPVGASGATGVPGQSGETGATGASGPGGKPGASGATGPKGVTGATGPKGITGATGPRGATGACGATGPIGASGVRGATGPMGPTGATGPAGVDGDLLAAGSFYDTSSQSIGSANAAAAVRLGEATPSGGNGVIASGVSVAGSTRVVVEEAGVYEVSVTLNVRSESGSTQRLLTWLERNGAPIARTTASSDVTPAGSATTVVRTFVVSAGAGDAFEVLWSASDTAVTLAATDAADGPARPGVASASVTVAQVR